MLNALKKRRAIRKFEPREVEREKIEILLEAATYAPNDRMREPWHFYVMQGDSLKGYQKKAYTVCCKNDVVIRGNSDGKSGDVTRIYWRG